MAGFDCTNVTAKRSGFDSEIILGKSILTFNEFSADQWLFTKALKQIVVNDVQHQWTKAGRYIRTRCFECGVSFDQDCKKETTFSKRFSLNILGCCNIFACSVVRSRNFVPYCSKDSVSIMASFMNGH